MDSIKNIIFDSINKNNVININTNNIQKKIFKI
jgi:hypothetical protein